MRLSFHGAAREVTGSCHLVEAGGQRVLVDCGLHQGGPDERAANAAPFAFDPASVDYLLLTHAHLDHCGRIPLLVKRGFRGEIVATAPTRELARLVLLDSARLQEDEARRAARKARRATPATRAARGRDAVPLYDTVDALDALAAFGRVATYGKPIDCGGVAVTFHDAGHIMGSAFLALELEEDGRRQRVVFSGDVGNSGKPIVRDPEPPPPADAVVLESTYGDRDHRSFEASRLELLAAVSSALERGGNVVIPTFALERAQELLYVLRQGRLEGRLPRHMRVFLDSPMAASATHVYRRHSDHFDADARRLLATGEDVFSFPGLEVAVDVADSQAINDVTGAVILAGSGMCTGGRVVHHLKHNLWRKESSVLFVSYAAHGTPARSIIDGRRDVRILGERVAVRASVHTINGFSGHAGRSELIGWHARCGTPARTFLVHGEAKPMDSLAAALEARGHRVATPGPLSSHPL